MRDARCVLRRSVKAKRKDAVVSKKPQAPVIGVGTGGAAGKTGGTLLTQHIMKEHGMIGAKNWRLQVSSAPPNTPSGSPPTRHPSPVTRHRPHRPSGRPSLHTSHIPCNAVTALNPLFL